MAVAVKNSPQPVAERPFNRLAVDSVLGVCYLLGALALVFYGVPALWDGVVTPALSAAIKTPVLVAFEILVMVAAALGLCVLGARLVGETPVPGLRAGIFFGCVVVLAVLVFASGFGVLLERWLPGQTALGATLTAAVGVGLCVALALVMARPASERWLVEVERQGWFTAAPYKRGQGLRVRRGTILGILILAGCGIYTLLQHNTLASGPLNWQLPVPFTEGRSLILLPDVALTVPLLLAAASLWLAYRVVHLPVFADFLIATEAELNKVSWTTRKRLVQDTIVVMVTVVLLTAFLFVVDQAWAFILTKVGVIQLGPASAQQAGPRELPW